MTLQDRITALAQAVGADIKALQAGGATGLAGPAAPTLVSPAADGEGSEVFTVGAYSHPLGVPKWRTQIQRARDAAFTLDVEASPIATQDASTTVTMTWEPRIGANYWRARDIDIFGAPGEWSAARAYRTPAGALGGGTLTQDGGYSVRTFTTSGTLTVSADTIVDVLVVAGGGGGGAYGGGGGGGGVLYTPARILAAGTYAITVGAGGAASISGSNSKFHTDPDAIGGGGGGSNSSAAQSGGSGGGGSGNIPAGAPGTVGQGYAGATGAGYATAGGGGAGGVGKAPIGSTAAGNGGSGFACAISPAATHYAGGGGGGGRIGYGDAPGTGGIGGGANGGVSVGNPAANGTGGGGGGGAYDGAYRPGGAGGSGVVIIRYQA